MAAHSRWRNSYNSALRTCGDTSHQERKADFAVRACLQRLLEIAPRNTSECTEIHVALDDLTLLKFLYRRYRRVGR
jgi:hypothetical protein